ncbi:hypothetical protein [Streptacidiphilus sp. EB103A]|uniref:hypothetical protein n=1 Tax=Streptacidiphilus sp. EB103A TaxID=3156275 RepID=UPI003511F98A
MPDFDFSSPPSQPPREQPGPSRWSVTSYRPVGRREFVDYRTLQLDSVDVARSHCAAAVSRPWVDRIVVTQHDCVATVGRIARDCLPGLGAPAALPPVPTGANEVKRFYRVRNFGPPVLRSGDAVRDRLAWMASNRGRHPYNLTDIPDPESAELLEVTLVRYKHTVAVGFRRPGSHIVAWDVMAPAHGPAAKEYRFTPPKDPAPESGRRRPEAAATGRKRLHCTWCG